MGADHANKRGPGRRFGIGLCRPGDPIELRREPGNRYDENAIAVFEQGGIQIGYVRSERAAWLARVMDRGKEVSAIFQEATPYGCVVRAAFGGEEPVLPAVDESSHGEADWWPDEEWPD